MAQVINNTDKLTYILTSYGLSRVAEALANPEIDIYLSKIKVGDANYEYYEPTETQTDLKNPIPNGSFYIIEKNLLEDGKTVSLHAVFPETFTNAEIREIGVYETVDGQDHLFAISTQQPLLKPSVELRYVMSVDYFALLKAANLADVYDQILLDPDNQLITEQDLDTLMNTILFTESNLMHQIGGNSRIIGLNRARQLQEKVESNRETYGYITAYNTYSTILNYTDADNVFGYWVFNYPRRVSPTNSIVDVGKGGRNFSTNLVINSYPRIYSGLMSMLTFKDKDVFYLNQGDTVLTFNEAAFFLTGSPSLTPDGIVTDFTTSDYVNSIPVTFNTSKAWKMYLDLTVGVTTDYEGILGNSNNYGISIWLHGTSPGGPEISIQLGNGNEWLTSLVFSAQENTNYKLCLSYDGNNAYSLSLFRNGVYQIVSSTTMNNPVPSSIGSFLFGKDLYDTHKPFSGSINLTNFSIIQDTTVITGGVYTSKGIMSFLDASQSNDASFSMLFAVNPVSSGNRTLLARSNYASNTHVFEVSETSDNRVVVRLFADAVNYMTFSTSANTVPNKAHSVGLVYRASNKTMDIFIGGKSKNVIKEVTGDYVHMNSTPSTLYSFTYTPANVIYADSNTAPSKLFNADGTSYTGTAWGISNDTVFFEGNTSTYTSSKNTQTVTLYAWTYNDGLEDHTIYTKEQQISEDTVLYNSDYTKYIGSEFKINLSGSTYVIGYNGFVTSYNSPKNIASITLYAFSYVSVPQVIWADDIYIPSTLYEANGNLYSGSDWSIIDHTIYYKGEGGATYDSTQNVPLPVLPVTSYIVGAEGNIKDPINSSVGTVCVINEELTNDELRSVLLDLEATLGNNPCITTY